MPINFPSNPTNGQTYTNPTTNTEYVFVSSYDTWKSNTSASVGGSPPGGSNTNVQYNDNGVLGGSSNLTFNGTTLYAQTIQDSAGDIRDLPVNTQTTSYTLTAADAGRLVSTSNNSVTVPANVFSAGDTISIFNNNTTNLSVVQGSSVTLYLAGTAVSGTRTLAQRGVCTVLCVAANTFAVGGSGLS